MANKKKYYAVNIPNKLTVVESWDECKKLVDGVSGALYKGFKTKIEAEDWLGLPTTEPSEDTEKSNNYEVIGDGTLCDDVIRVYVDGSFQNSLSKYAGWGIVALQNAEIIHQDYGVTRGPALSRNIDGELRASLEAMKWAAQSERQIHLYHDYEGIAKWALGSWKAKSEIAKMYVQACQPWLAWVKFIKVSAHSGDTWNDKADELAKLGIKEWEQNETQ